MVHSTTRMEKEKFSITKREMWKGPKIIEVMLSYLTQLDSLKASLKEWFNRVCNQIYYTCTPRSIKDVSKLIFILEIKKVISYYRCVEVTGHFDNNIYEVE